MTDGGGQFYSTVALQLYDMLSVRKERIDPGQPWQDFTLIIFRYYQESLLKLSNILF